MIIWRWSAITGEAAAKSKLPLQNLVWADGKRMALRVQSGDMDHTITGYIGDSR